MRRTMILAAVAVLPTLALVASGCGSSPSSPQVASLAGGATTTGATSAATPPPGAAPSGGGGGLRMVMKAKNGLAFSRCMRSHGVANFPDPSSDGSIQIGSGSGVDPRTATFQKAQQACQKLIGGGKPPSPAELAKARQQALAFSACMRRHGVPDFPDPDFSGGHIGIRIKGNLDPQSPTFQAAQRACQGFMKLPGGKG